MYRSWIESKLKMRGGTDPNKRPATVAVPDEKSEDGYTELERTGKE